MEQQLPVMTELGVQFTARSGMETAASSGVHRGRPFGGVSIAWASNLNHVVRPLANYRHHRIVCVELLAVPNPILLASVYMPFYDSSNRAECISETIDAISMMEGIIEDHPHHQIIIGGDLNTELEGNSPFDIYWREFVLKYDLECCDSLVHSRSNPNDGGHANGSSAANNGDMDGGTGLGSGSTSGSTAGSSPTYTYHHASLNQKKWNDHFLVSSSIIAATRDHQILDEGDNLSDHLPVIMSLAVNCSAPMMGEQNIDASVPVQTLKWEKCSSEYKVAYSECLTKSLNDSPSLLTGCHNCHCKGVACRSSIQAEFDSITHQLSSADKILPRHKPGVQKNWWTEELSALKTQCMEIHQIWQAEGKPRQGAIYNERMRVRAEYRKAIRNAQRKPKQSCWNRLHETLASKSTDSFWKEWKKLYGANKSHLHPVVNGLSSKQDISESFRSHFTEISKPNNVDRVQELEGEFNSKYSLAWASHSQSCNCGNYNISIDNVIDAAFSLKKGKSSDDDGVSAEHFFHAPLELFVRLQKLFNAMVRHSFVPRQFQLGTIIPIVKDHQGNLGDLNNYRGITIAPIASKIFEHLLRILFGEFLTTSGFQFGFKKRSSTSHAIYCLKETINYYTERGSSVYCSFLDASKAFDRLVHAGLFLKLLERNIPFIFLDLLIHWYSNLQCRVRWGECHSSWFDIIAGVRQGGILSPDFYCIYVDDLVVILAQLGVGCHLRDNFLSALLYADDMALLSPSLKGLQILMKACEKYCFDWDICLNPKKTKNMAFGKRVTNLCPLFLNGGEIEWVTSWKYLGVDLESLHAFDWAFEGKLSFYKCLNAMVL